MKPNRSIQTFLLLSIFSLITIGGVFNASLIYHESKEQIEELFDAELAQLSRLLQSLLNGLPKRDEQLEYFDEEVLAYHFDEEHESSDLGHAYERKIAIQIWRTDGTLILANHLPLPTIFSDLNEGYHSINVSYVEWRTFTLKDDINQLWIRVAQREDVRTELTSEIALEGLWPSLIMIPLVLALSALLIRRGLSPINSISKELKNRSYDNLIAIPEHNAPPELQQMIKELNNLFNRVSESYEREKRFTSDAAHELRTPLSITKVHLQNILQVASEPKLKLFASKALKGVERLTHLVEQLLVLSRLETGQQTGKISTFNATEVIEELLSEIQESPSYQALNVSSSIDQDIFISGDDINFRILARNLIDNACRYSTGEVEIKLDKSGLSLYNTSNHIPDDELDSLFERFKRRPESISEGSGLGLAICKEICERHRYKLTLSNQALPKGVNTSLTF